MKDSQKLSVYFNGDKTLFLIPLYQRNYAWQRKHCERLFDDLKKVNKNHINSHFFGSIVSVRANEVDDDLLIIDGQQRITTISLLILAAIHCVKAGEMKCGMPDGDIDEYLTDQKNKYLRAKYHQGDRTIKLRPIDNDIKAYDAVFNDDEEAISQYEKSGIVINYRLFCTLIKNNDLTFKDLIEAIECLVIIDIRLDSSDNPQLIFESLNSCGKDLEEADKVRNYLLMSLTADIQEDYYRKYWSKIERNTDMEPTMFIRDYLTVKRKTISSINELYFDFKRYDEENQFERRDLLEDMLKYSYFYRKASGKDYNEGHSSSVDKKFKQLSYIGSMVCMPFYLAFLNYAQEQNLPDSEVYNVLDVVENYWARRIMCGYPANVMAKSFALLHSDVMRIVKQHQQRDIPLTVPYAEVLKFIFLRKQGNAVFPEDTEVQEEFQVRNVYRMPLDYRCFLFERLENKDHKEANDNLVEHIKDGTYSFEHIMPQTLTAQWKQELGPDFERIHEQYLHTFANLTLTAYNSNYGNHSFAEKKEGYQDREGKQIYGFKDSNFKLSNYLKLVNHWGEEEIKERGNKLLQDFLYLWPMIQTTYVPLEQDLDDVSFDDDDVELTGRKIQKFSYRGEEHEVATWKAMTVEVCKLIYQENPTAVQYLSQKDDCFHVEEAKGRTKIADDCYVWTAASTKSLCSVLELLFKEANIEKSKLEFHLIPQRDNVIEDGGDQE